MPRFRVSRWQVEIIDVGGIGLKERYRCYRCKRRTDEFTFDPCPRCGFPEADKRWRWGKLVDWARELGRSVVSNVFTLASNQSVSPDGEPGIR